MIFQYWSRDLTIRPYAQAINHNEVFFTCNVCLHSEHSVSIRWGHLLTFFLFFFSFQNFVVVRNSHIIKTLAGLRMSNRSNTKYISTFIKRSTNQQSFTKEDARVWSDEDNWRTATAADNPAWLLLLLILLICLWLIR